MSCIAAAVLLLQIGAPALTEARFHSGDDVAWAASDLDERDWAEVTVPANWVHHGAGPDHGRGWYRLRFHAPAPRAALGLYFETIVGSIEVYLNGERVGADGYIEHPFQDLAPAARLYHLPQEVLRSGVNVLAVRLATRYTAGGLLDRPPRVGPLVDLLGRKLAVDRRDLAVEISYLTVLLLFSITGVVLAILGLRRTDLALFVLFIGVLSLGAAADSALLGNLDMRSAWPTKLSWSSGLLAPGLYVALISAFLGQTLRWPEKVAVRASIVLAVFFLFDAAYTYDDVTELIAYPLLGYAVLLGVWIPAMAWRAGDREASWFFVGGLGAMLTIVSDVLQGLDMLGVRPCQYVWSAAVLIIVFSVLGAVLVRTVRVHERVKLLSARVLDAEEQERARIARDLHDGVGQWVAAIELEVKGLIARLRKGGDAKAAELEALGEAIEQCRIDLRHVAHDLRPAFFDDMDLLGALGWYGRRFAERTGVDVDVAGPPSVHASRRVTESLYRIFQEALGNAARHGKASRVIARIDEADGQLELCIVDDGGGFDVAAAEKGLGLCSMRERTEMLGGELSLISEPGAGAQILARVPADA